MRVHGLRRVSKGFPPASEGFQGVPRCSLKDAVAGFLLEQRGDNVNGAEGQRRPQGRRRDPASKRAELLVGGHAFVVQRGLGASSQGSGLDEGGGE